MSRLSERRPGGWPVVIVAGPTGVGKTEVALALARTLSAEVISADSRQIYRDLCVGTAKPRGAWVKTAGGPRYLVDGVVHHLIDHVSPEETYTAGRFVKEARAVLEDLTRRGVPAVLAGGTGLYLRSLVRGLAALPEADPAIRKKLSERAEQEGRGALHAELSRVDPGSARAIPPNNLQRVIRAMEVYLITGTPLSRLQKEGTHPAPWDFVWFGLRPDLKGYQERLDQRCKSMEQGILAETKALLERGLPPASPAFQSLGYREAVAHIAGRSTLDAFRRALAAQTRPYAKRQLTWLRGEPGLSWLDIPLPPRPQETARLILSLLGR